MDTRCCRFCGSEFEKYTMGRLKGDIDGTFNEGYCNKFCRKDHEKQLIKEGKMEPIESNSFGTIIDSKCTDAAGQPIWWPKKAGVNGYYDRYLGQHFKSKKDKSEFMKKKGFVMDGSDGRKHWPVEAGDCRSKSYRRENFIDD